MRRCLVDFVFNASGHQVSSQSTSCTAGSKSDSYVALGRDYNLSTMSLPEAGLRVTYVGTSMWTQALQTLKGITSHLATASVSARPSVLYASVGAWMMYVNDMRLHAQVANLMHTALDGLANLIASPQVLIYGTTLGMHNRNQTFDQRFLLPLLHNKSQLRREASEWNEARPARDDARRGHWRLFDRSNHALSWNVTADGRRGIRAANGHAHHPWSTMSIGFACLPWTSFVHRPSCTMVRWDLQRVMQRSTRGLTRGTRPRHSMEVVQDAPTARILRASCFISPLGVWALVDSMLS